MYHFLTSTEALTVARDLFASYARPELPMVDVSDAALDALASKYGTTDIDDQDRCEAEASIDDFMSRMDCVPIPDDLA